MDINKEIAEHTTQVEAIITKYLPKESGYQKTVMEAMNYSFLAGGKRLRPMLMQETYRLFGGSSDIIEPFMAAIEMIHTYSLIHDDLPAMDNDDYRRGRKTTHVVYGEAMGILAGDALLNFAFETACKGLMQDVMLIGAVLAGASEKEQQVILQVAKDVGLAFQIQDDILDVTSDMETLGKPIGSDEKNHKTTYVTIRGLAQAQKDVEKISERALEGVASLSEENVFLNELIRYLIHRKK